MATSGPYSAVSSRRCGRFNSLALGDGKDRLGTADATPGNRLGTADAAPVVRGELTAIISAEGKLLGKVVTDEGIFRLHGVPATDQPDLSGRWLAQVEALSSSDTQDSALSASPDEPAERLRRAGSTQHSTFFPKYGWIGLALIVCEELADNRPSNLARTDIHCAAVF